MGPFDIFMTLVCVCVVIGLITNPRAINKVVLATNRGISNWFEKLLSPTVDRFDQGDLEPATGYVDVPVPEEIDYKKLEQDNLKSMRDSWDERFLKLHKLEDLTDAQLEQLSKYRDIDEEAVLIEANKRLHARNVERRRQRALMKPSDLEYLRSISYDPTQVGMLSNKCARQKHHTCRDMMCDCECHEDEDDLI